MWGGGGRGLVRERGGGGVEGGIYVTSFCCAASHE